LAPLPVDSPGSIVRSSISGCRPLDITENLLCDKNRVQIPARAPQFILILHKVFRHLLYKKLRELQIIEMISLGIQEEIFDDFFRKLKDVELPEDLINELRMLLERGEIGTEEKILEAVRRGTKGANKHQKR